MSYEEEEFWKKYKEYVEESYPRHKKIVLALNALASPPHVTGSPLFDLGCGRVQEASWIFGVSNYYGVDRTVPNVDNFFQLDYRHPDDEKKLFMLLRAVKPETVCSLFSSEITDDKKSNYSLYRKIFNKIPSVKRMFLSGFYYVDKMSSHQVKENGDLVSWQTLDLQDELLSSIKESRIYSEAPSELFGPNVIEVWKLLERRKKDV